MAPLAAHHDKRVNINMKDMSFVKVMRPMFAAERKLFNKM